MASPIELSPCFRGGYPRMNRFRAKFLIVIRSFFERERLKDDSCCVFQTKPATDSTAKLPLIPVNPATP